MNRGTIGCERNRLFERRDGGIVFFAAQRVVRPVQMRVGHVARLVLGRILRRVGGLAEGKRRE